MKTLSSLICGALCFGAMHGFAGDATRIRELLSRVPAAELPDSAAKFTSQAKPKDLEATAVNVTKAALELNPASAPAVVGAMCRVVPEVAAIIAGTAAKEQPKQASVIARAAAAAAPSNVGKIVTAVCRAVPSDYRNVAIAVAAVAPKAGKEILDGVATALPNLKPYIQQAILSYAGNPPVASALDQAVSLSDAQAGSATTASAPIRAARGPAVGPPYIPLSTTPGNVLPGNSGELPNGGRGYAAP